LLEIVSLLAALRLNMTVLHWGELFPWSFEERLRSPYAYPEQVISGFYSRLREEGIEAYTLVPGPDYFGFILRLKSFAYLRRGKDTIDALDIRMPGARQLVYEMIDDIVHICTPTGIFLESDGIRPSDWNFQEDSRSRYREGEETGYYDGLINMMNNKDRPLIFQETRERATAPDFLREKSGTLAVHSDRIDAHGLTGQGDTRSWSILPLECSPSGFTLASYGILLVPLGSSLVDSGMEAPIAPGLIPPLIKAAAYLWNGGEIETDPDMEEYRWSLLGKIDSLWKVYENFELAIQHIYSLSIELHNRYSFFLSQEPEYDPGGRDIRILIKQADKAIHTAQEVLKDCMDTSRSFIPPGWMEYRCKIKLINALETLTTIKQRVCLHIDIQTGSGYRARNE